jgi:hypothetical protein
MWGGCTGMSIEYLVGYNARLLYVGPGNSSNINFLHNTTGGLPSSTSSGIRMALQDRSISIEK